VDREELLSALTLQVGLDIAREHTDHCFAGVELGAKKISLKVALMFCILAATSFI
jgi:hypothetical protein